MTPKTPALHAVRLAVAAAAAATLTCACSSAPSSGGATAGDASASDDAASSDDAGRLPCSASSACDASPDEGAPTPPADAASDASPDAGRPMPAQCAGRKIVFYDGFDGTSLDTTKWNTKYAFCGSGCCSLPSNGEQECYDDGQVQVHGGALHLVGTPQPQVNGLPYASGMISSGGVDGAAPKFDFQYGYFEARVNIPAGQGLWPAFWTGNSDGSWPPEIDVMEILGNQPDVWYGTVHYSTSSQNNVGDGTSWQGPDFSQGWHTFGVDWEPGQLVWYVDGVERKRVTAATEVQSKRAYLMADLAVGGNWPGDPNASTVFPADYEVDYVLVCQ